MEALKVVIQSLEDSVNGKAIVDGLKKQDIVETKDFTVGIMEGGTVSGQTSLMFILRQPDGKAYIAQMTENHFNSLAQILRGANERFKLTNKNRGQGSEHK